MVAAPTGFNWKIFFPYFPQKIHYKSILWKFSSKVITVVDDTVNVTNQKACDYKIEHIKMSQSNEMQWQLIDQLTSTINENLLFN